MGWPGNVVETGIILRPLVPVAGQHGYGAAEGQALLEARQEFDSVGLLPVRGQWTLTRTTTVQLCLHIGSFQRQPWRTSVHHHAHTTAVGFTKGGNPE